jgi:methionyl-tRNA formyltransferase
VRIAFFGTPDFAVPTLERLLAGRHRVVAVVSQPDRPAGRGRALSTSPVAQVALRAGVPLLRPERVDAPDVLAALREAAPDVGVVVAYGQFLSRRLRELPARGYLVNAHASLLPRHRGAAPIAHALLAGDAETGISVMRVEREMDAGPVAAVKRIAIAEEWSCGELSSRLARLAAEAIEEALDAIEAERVVWREQDASQATLAPKLESADAWLDWSQPATALVRRVRALSPEPGARTRLRGEPLRVLAALAEPGPVDRPPGTVQSAPGRPVRIATADGWLVPLELQRAGGRPLPTDAFLRGRPIPDGEVLGPQAAGGRAQ